MVDHCLDRAPALATGVGISCPLRPIVQSDGRGYQLEVRVVPVLGVRKHLCQRHVEQLNHDFSDFSQNSPPVLRSDQ